MTAIKRPSMTGALLILQTTSIPTRDPQGIKLEEVPASVDSELFRFAGGQLPATRDRLWMQPGKRTGREAVELALDGASR
jgi:hypothetical protein